MNKITRIILPSCIALVLIALGHKACRYYYGRYPSIELSKTQYPTRGIDLSAHNGNIDFVALKKGGIDFVMLKATEGAAFTDKKFHENYQKARQAGLRVGAYHFFRFDREGALQANHFLHTVKGLEFDFPLVIDVEKEGKYPKGYNESDIKHYLREAINHLELHGQQVMIYTNKSMYRKLIAQEFANYPLWICSFTNPPGPKVWYMWQYSHRGKVPGVKGHVDLNVINPRHGHAH